MNRQRWWVGACILGIVVGVAVPWLQAGEVPPSTHAKASPPNVVLIISDDQAWTDYSFMGHPVIQTPRLDRLARESATFPHGYVPTALCRPSLASIITGLYPRQHRITGNDPAIPASLSGQNARRDQQYLATCEQLIRNIERVPTLPRLLAEQGYVSFQSGKWWEGAPSRGGFTDGMTHGDPLRGGRHGDEGLKIGRQGMEPIFDFIKQSAGRSFFLWYAPFLPHSPHNPPARLLQKYQAEGRPEALAKYFAMCEWFDETCGQLLDFLDAEGLRDNTLVIYVTDNGWIQRTEQSHVPEGWNQPFAPGSKQSPYEGGVRTPIMIRWPGHVTPGTYETRVTSLDLMPTILEACGVSVPAELPGRSLWRACQGEPLDRNVIYGESFAHDVADLERPAASLLYQWCIEGDWKLILRRPGQVGRYRVVHAATTQNSDPVELYRLSTDPHERQNVAAEHPDVVQRLRESIRRQWDPEEPGQP